MRAALHVHQPSPQFQLQGVDLSLDVEPHARRHDDPMHLWDGQGDARLLCCIRDVFGLDRVPSGSLVLSDERVVVLASDAVGDRRARFEDATISLDRADDRS